MVFDFQGSMVIRSFNIWQNRNSIGFDSLIGVVEAASNQTEIEVVLDLPPVIKSVTSHLGEFNDEQVQLLSTHECQASKLGPQRTVSEQLN